MIARVIGRHMRENLWCPGDGGVALIAFLVGDEMIYEFARRLHAVMAGRACTGSNRRMIEPGWQPGVRRMTIVTGVVAGDVTGMLTGGVDTIMTVKARSGRDTAVIETGRRQPGRG